MNGFVHDLRYGLRQMAKSRGFTATALIVLAVGIGANTAIYSLLDQALLRSLPVKEPNRLVLVRHSGRDEGASYLRTDNDFYFSYPMYRDLRDHNTVFSGLMATDWAQVGIEWHNQPERVDAELVSGNYFDVLGVQPALGRLLVPSDDVAEDANPVAVLSFSYWQRRFALDPQILNQSISINGHPFTVIGVAPPGFHSVVAGDAPALFTPMMMKPEITPGWNDLDVRRSIWLNLVGRLRPGISRQPAQAGLDPLWHSLRAEELNQLGGHRSEQFREEFLTQSHLFLAPGARGVPMHSSASLPLLIVTAMASLVLLLTCANVGSLLLVRMAGRIREMSVRYALGAKPRRVLRQLLVEGMLLGLAGGVAGLLLAPPVSAFLIGLMWQGGSGEAPFSSRPDGRVLAFNFSLALGVSLLFSLAPALRFWRPDLTHALKQQMATTAGGPPRFRRILVVVQMALSLLLLVGAGLFVRTLRNLQTVDVGFRTDHLVTFAMDPALAGYAPEQTGALYQRVFEKLAGLPGVRSTAATNDPELANNDTGQNITVSGYPARADEDMDVERERISPAYRSTLGLSLLAGREINQQDRQGAQKVAVVNESFARHYFGASERAVGRHFGWGAGDDVKTDVEIVGVVNDAKHASLREGTRRTVFTPYLQDAPPGALTFYVRTWQPPEPAEASIRGAVLALDSKLVLNHFQTMQQQINDNLSAERLIAFLASGFGVLAALLAAAGVYGVLAYTTAQRTREIGIRVALGATRGEVMRMVLVEVFWLAGIGVAAGLPIALVLARTLQSELFGISSQDPLTLGAVVFLVSGLAFASAALPARRAAQVDPMAALRYE